MAANKILKAKLAEATGQVPARVRSPSPYRICDQEGGGQTAGSTAGSPPRDTRSPLRAPCAVKDEKARSADGRSSSSSCSRSRSRGGCSTPRRRPPSRDVRHRRRGQRVKHRRSNRSLSLSAARKRGSRSRSFARSCSHRSRSRGGCRISPSRIGPYGTGDHRMDLDSFISKNALEPRVAHALRTMTLPRQKKVMGTDGGENGFLLIGRVKNPNAVVMTRIRNLEREGT